jgi:hypothetical protein
MTITVEDGTKCMLAKYGPNKLFGDDIDERKKLDDGPAIQIFNSVWQNKLERAVKMADPCDSDYAYERLTNRQQNYFDHHQEHRSFRLQELNAEFLVQLDPQEDGDYILTQFVLCKKTDDIVDRSLERRKAHRIKTGRFIIGYCSCSLPCQSKR